MRNRSTVRILIAVAVVVVAAAAALYWLGSGALRDWLISLHGGHGRH